MRKSGTLSACTFVRRSLPLKGCFGYQAETRDELRLPCRSIAPLNEDFYSSATPRVQLLKHLVTTSQELPTSVVLQSARHRGTTPAATLLPGLVMVYVSKSSLVRLALSVGHVARGCDPQLTSVCIELPFDHSFRKSPGRGLSRFRGTELRSVPLPCIRQLVAIRYRLRPD